ncbi:universal stress protein [Aeromonas simiae]|uniref:Universal stress protein n=1 Tax=Aeromonas simiae TaxID=218936 RepID=A0A5J6WX19_9GAMM|nr:universal stress protein [Aeromonas simiae]QFI53825.1 universal stress protein [Aeromonas simiae]
MSIQSILCPVDFSPMSKPVLDYAVSMAQTHNASLRLVHVVDQLQGFDSYKILHMTAAEITFQLEQQAKAHLTELAASLPVPTTFEICFGRAPDEITALAAKEKCDLVVMGSHGRTGIAHLLVGSVAEAVVRHSPCPVLIVRQQPEA